MDGDSEKNEKTFGSEDDLPDSGNILQSSRLRCLIPRSDAMDGVFLGNRFNLLFHVCPIFWLILFAKSK
jgi:hypothetical protein